MFKISVIDGRTVRRLVLEGTFITPWVSELRTTWATANADLQDRKLVLDLKNVTRISEEGEDALSELMREGPRSAASTHNYSSVAGVGVDGHWPQWRRPAVVQVTIPKTGWSLELLTSTTRSTGTAERFHRKGERAEIRSGVAS